MGLQKFSALSEAPRPAKYLVWQDWAEWQAFLEFASAYFQGRGIAKPIVVEIGVMHNEQRNFYRELLGAEHIGIDINVNNAPDIVGDSAAPETVEKLKALLAGREIDLLFIDGNHNDFGVRTDFNLYGPLTRHLIALHDVHATMTHVTPVNTFWNEMANANEYMTVVFHRYGSIVSLEKQKFLNMGIGVVIKG
jgi:hypothetical protein